MPAIPENFLLGGYGFNPAHAGAAGTSDVNLVGAINGLAYDITQVTGSAPATITSPLSAAHTTITSPLGTTVPATSVGAALGAYATPATPTDSENTADRTRLNELRTDVIELRNYVTALQAEMNLSRSREDALRTEVVALRTAQSSRAGITRRITPQASYS